MEKHKPVRHGLEPVRNENNSGNQTTQADTGCMNDSNKTGLKTPRKVNPVSPR